MCDADWADIASGMAASCAAAATCQHVLAENTHQREVEQGDEDDAGVVLPGDDGHLGDGEHRDGTDCDSRRAAPEFSAAG